MSARPCASAMAQNGVRISTSTKRTDVVPGTNQNVARIAQPTDGNEFNTGIRRRWMA